MSDIPEGYFHKGVELLDFRREPRLVYTSDGNKKKKRKRNRTSNVNSDRARRLMVALVERDGDRCHYCLEKMIPPRPDGKFVPEAMSREHIVPASVGGTNEQFNLVLACSACNNFRGDVPMYCDCRFCLRAYDRFLITKEMKNAFTSRQSSGQVAFSKLSGPEGH